MSNNSGYRDDSATKQAVEGRDKSGRFAVGNTPKTGFHTNPERRSNGSWKKERTPRAKFERIFAEMTVGEYLAQINEENAIENLDAMIGDVVVSERLANIFENDPEGKGRLRVNSKEFDSLMYYVYGHKSESDTTIRNDEKDPFIIKGFVMPIAPKDFIDENGNQMKQEL